MRVYLDTSALLKRIIDERGSEQLRIALRQHVNDHARFVTSRLASVEISRGLRTRFDIGYTAAADYLNDALSGIAEHPLGDEVISLSRRLNPHKLRSQDAIHVASAILLDSDLLITYDDRMTDAAEHNGLRCSAPGR
ncbi:MAG: type II toxin-antitoxin system VapC family toxin [Pseudonocardia sp.]|nr:type II toxin-antitoxin system VapC family toxin [Pseudonocardia sp.]